MRKINVYISVRHFDFWWGIYGFKNKTSWEDMIIYRKWGNGFRKLAWSCICTKPYFKSSLEDLINDPDEKEFVEEITEFLDSGQIKYHYYYDNPNDTDFYEVPYKAPRNKKNIKPRNIETWYSSDGVDKEVIDKCARGFCEEFLDIKVDSVEFKEVVSLEDAINSYLEHLKTLEQNPKIVFSDLLIEQLESELKIPKEKVLEILNRSLK